MTPPHPQTDRTPVMSPSEISQVTEASRVLVDMILPAVRDELARSFAVRDRAKAEETSSAMIKLPKRVRLWQAIAAVLGALGVGGTGAYAGTLGVAHDIAADQARSGEAAARSAVEARQAAEALVTPRTEPADVGRLADTLDRLDTRLEGIEARLERLETRRR